MSLKISNVCQRCVEPEFLHSYSVSGLKALIPAPGVNPDLKN